VQNIREFVVNADNPRSIAARARQKRWQRLLREFPDLTEMNVVDLGGRPRAWRAAPVQPKHVLCVNVEGLEGDGRIECIRGDACTIDGIGTFDLVYSNSTIEHVGGHFRCHQFADTTRRLASKYWVQTPYRYFPIEPHYVFPLVQHLPPPLRGRIGQMWSPSWVRNDPEDVLSIELLSKTALKLYFPEATIISERVVGVPKSLVAIHNA